MKFSLIIPCFNVAMVLPASIDDAYRAASSLTEDFELILVNDGSTDDTPALIDDAARRLPKTVAIHLPHNYGKGAAIVRGVAASAGDIIAFTDADLPYGIEPFYAMWNYLCAHPSYVAVSGTRRHPHAWQHARPGWVRRWGSAIFSYGARRVVRGITDTQCGCKMFRRTQVLPVFASLKTLGFAFDLEVLARLERAGLLLGEVPVYLRQQGSVSSVGVRDTIRMFKDFCSLYRTL